MPVTAGAYSTRNRPPASDALPRRSLSDDVNGLNNNGNLTGSARQPQAARPYCRALSRASSSSALMPRSKVTPK